MAEIYEQGNIQITDFSDLGEGWRKYGNIEVSYDGSRARFARDSSGDDATYTWPVPATFGAGFVETTVPSDFRLLADIAVDLAVDSVTAEYVGIALRASNYAQWIVIDTTANIVRSILKDGVGGTTLESVALPISASLRWQVQLRWTGSVVAGDIRPYEDRDDLTAWTALTISTTSLPSVPEWAGIGMQGTTNIHAPELYVYSMRIDFPSEPARHWYALADIPGSRVPVELLLNRKSRASSAAHWSRDDYFVADSDKSLIGSTPIKDLQAEYSTHELTRYLTQLEAVTGLTIGHAWFGNPRCAVTGQLLYTELRPTIVTATDVSGRFGDRCFQFTATNDHSLAAFDMSVAEIPDDESWLAMMIVSSTGVPASNQPLFGKQDLFKIAPVPRNGWMIWQNTGDIMFDLSDTVGGTQTTTAARVYSAGVFYAVSARINRTTELAEIADEATASATVSTAGLSYACDTRPLRIGDARINRAETSPAMRVHLLAFAYGAQVESPTLTTLNADLLAAAT